MIRLADPIGRAGGLNTYSYAFNSPVMLTDPTGEIAPLIVAAVEVVGGAEAVGAVALRVAVRIGARVVVRWLTPQFLARIAPLWIRLGITFDVMDVAGFGFVVADPDSSAGDIAAAGMGLALSIADPTLGNLIKKGGNAAAKAAKKSLRDRMSPDEVARYDNYWEKHAPIQSRPYDIQRRYNEDGSIKQVTTYDEYGRRHRQFDLIDGRHPEHQHDFEYSASFPLGSRSSEHLPINE